MVLYFHRALVQYQHLTMSCASLEVHRQRVPTVVCCWRSTPWLVGNKKNTLRRLSPLPHPSLLPTILHYCAFGRGAPMGLRVFPRHVGARECCGMTRGIPRPQAPARHYIHGIPRAPAKFYGNLSIKTLLGTHMITYTWESWYLTKVSMASCYDTLYNNPKQCQRPLSVESIHTANGALAAANATRNVRWRTREVEMPPAAACAGGRQSRARRNSQCHPWPFPCGRPKKQSRGRPEAFAWALAGNHVINDGRSRGTPPRANAQEQQRPTGDRVVTPIRSFRVAARAKRSRVLTGFPTRFMSQKKGITSQVAGIPPPPALHNVGENESVWRHWAM